MTRSALVLAAVGLAVLGGPRPPAARRLRALWPRPPESLAARGTVARRGAVALTAAAAYVLIGGVVGLVVGAAAGVAIQRVLRRLEPARSRAIREQRNAHLPVALDLLAVCLRAGNPLVVALETVADALPGPLATDLAAAAALQRLGAAPAVAWSRYGEDPVLAPVVRLIRRSASSGSRLATGFERLAAERRAAAAAAGELRARRAGVLATAPLGLCYLPAFVCLGVVPLVLSLTDAVLV